MIKNAQQLQVTRQQLGRLRVTLESLKSSDRRETATQARISALEADVAKLEQDIEDYIAAERGECDFTPIANFDRIGKLLVQARIAGHLTQDELARELGRKPQQIQRYEREEYSSASLDTVSKVASVLLRKVPGEHADEATAAGKVLEV